MAGDGDKGPRTEGLHRRGGGDRRKKRQEKVVADYSARCDLDTRL